MRTITPALLAIALLAPLAAAQSEDPKPDPPRRAPTTAPTSQTGTVRILKPGEKVSDPPRAEPAKSAEAPTSPPPNEQQLLEANAARNLGHRAEAVRLAQKVVPTVVLVDDGASFADAIAGWARETRYPVLWDDGSTEAGEHIARFVHAFKPERVVRWDSKKRWPEDAESRERLIFEARSAALEITPKPKQHADNAMLEWLSSIHYDPTGVILACPTDPAWPAALALSAGRFQPIVFTRSTYGTPGGGMGADRAETVNQTAIAGLKTLDVEWEGLGSGIDAVTLVGGFPVRVKVGEDDYRSLTDRVGRMSGEFSLPNARPGTGPRAARWAWCGQIFGSEPYAAYAAMCSLFLTTETTWAFNTYADGLIPEYDPRKAAELLDENMRFTSTVIDGNGRNGLTSWRAAVSNGGIDAGLVLVNSHGNAPEFNFADKTRAYPGDVPLLTRPALVQFIHSFSMQRPDDPGTVGARWLDHGVYAYVGSMYEPYLDAFVPPLALGARLAEGWAFGAAARTDLRGWWRITTHGDPLITLGPAGSRTDAPLALTGATDLDKAMRDALERKDYATAVRSLVLLGRDHDAARLVSGLMKDQPASVTRPLAESAVGAMFRDRNFAGVLDLWRYVGPQAIGTPVLADALWGAARMQLSLGERSGTLSRLKQNLRPLQQAEDAVEIADWIARTDSPRAAADYLRPLLNRSGGEPRARRILNEAVRRHGG